MSGFKDHFSTQAAEYARFRPVYPQAFFDAIGERVPGRDLAIDIATGNGQIALRLADRWRSVVAIDASASQLEKAARHPRVEYRLQRAESTGLPSGSADLLTVGQALHWFDIDAFNREAERVLVAGGLLVCVSYGICRVSDEVDEIFTRLYSGLLEDYWPPEREWVESGYRGIELPGEPIEFPALSMTAAWTSEAMLGYFRSWSATQRALSATGRDPVDRIAERLRAAWGTSERQVSWPLTVLAARMPG